MPMRPGQPMTLRSRWVLKVVARMASVSAAANFGDASTRRRVSPVYTLLPHLQQPRWQDLLLSGDNEFAQRYESWRSRLEVAQQKHRAGDILVLAEETPVRALAVEARFQAGRALMRLPQFTFALEQFDAALAIDDEHLGSRQQRAVCLGRLRRTEEAREAALQLTEEHPDDPECWSLAGRVEKSAWIDRFREPGDVFRPRLCGRLVRFGPRSGSSCRG